MNKKTLKKSKMISTQKKTITKKPTASTIKKYISQFKKDGISYLNQLSIDDLVSMLKYANKVYYNKSDHIMTDNEYDILKEYIEEKDPKHPALKEVGAPIKKKKVQLPYEMWSMDKIKPSTKALDNYLKKYNDPPSYIISAKLDGVSGLYSTEGDGSPSLYTRGNGIVGQDVSHLLRFISLPKEKGIVLRGEFIAKKDPTVKKLRNIVAGLVNKIKYTASDIEILENTLEFVAYEVIQPVMTPKEQFEYLQQQNITHAFFKEEIQITSDVLSTHLQNLRNNYDYDIDGVICTHNKIYPRVSSNPEHAFAFKMIMTDQIAEAKVLDVLWSPSKDGYLKPRIQIEPIELQGTTIQYATAFNAAFVKQHKLGVGAVVKILRSGDVIPYIQEVVVPAEQIQWPKEDYIWTDTNIDIILVNQKDNVVVQQKQLLLFFKRIGVEGLSEGTIKKFVQAGYKTIPNILSLSIEDIIQLDGFKEKSATKLHQSIQHALQNASLIDFMTASNLFGRGLGSKKLEAIMDKYPTLFQIYSTMSMDALCKLIVQVDGIASKTATSFVQSLNPFVEFMNTIQQSHILKVIETKTVQNDLHDTNKKSSLEGHTYVFSGFRNKEYEKIIQARGGKVSTSVSKNTTHLVVKSKEKGGSKMEKAESLGIPIITLEELEKLL
jgi:NAD-dependent DNA ligase